MGDNQILFDNIHIKISLADWETYLNYCVLFWETRLGQVWWYISPELFTLQWETTRQRLEDMNLKVW